MSLKIYKALGKKTATDLLRHFKSVKKIKQLSFKELETFLGKSKAGIIISYFQKKGGVDENPAPF